MQSTRLQIMPGAVLLVAIGMSSTALGAFTLYHDPAPGVAFQEAQELAFLGATSNLTLIDFDDVASGTILTGNEYAGLGAVFSQPGGFQLEARGDNPNFTPRSTPNSLHTLGGLTVDERIQMDLTTPQNAVGLWVIDSEFDSPTMDETLDFYDASEQLIASVLLPIADIVTEDPNYNWFFGITSSVPIAKVILNESPDEAITEEVGFDDVYFGVPEPGTFVAAALGALALLRRRR